MAFTEGVTLREHVFPECLVAAALVVSHLSDEPVGHVAVLITVSAKNS